MPGLRRPRYTARSAFHDVGTAALLGVDETFLAQQRESVLDCAIADVVALHERSLGRQELPRLDLPRLDYAAKDVR